MATRAVVTASTTMLTATLATASLGQGPRVASTPWQDARVAAVARLEAGQRIRVEGSSSELLTGTFQRTSDGVLLLNSESGERSLPVADMTGLWVRGSSWQTGSAVGALLLAAGGALFAVYACGVGEQENTAGCGLAGGFAGALAGGLVGAVIGSAIPKWHRRYP